MLDTVVLVIPWGRYRVFLPQMFTPNANMLFERNGNYLVKCVNNPTSKDKKKGKYRPRMTLIKRMTRKGTEIPLRIEFSVAKMLFGNNVDEVQDNNFENVTSALHKALYEMGVSVSIADIKNAKVSTFHPSKNIELSDGYTSRFVVNELGKINLTMKMDLNKDSFRNSGTSLQLYTNSHSVVIYDKVRDLRKPEKRAIDKDQNSLQLSLFDQLRNKEKKEILRIEVRLAKKVKMNAVLKRLGFKENPTFSEVFKKEVCQKIVKDYWEQIIVNENLFIFEVNTNSNDTLSKLFKSFPEISPKEAIYLVGLTAVCKEGTRDARTIIEQNSTLRTWYRIAKDLDHLNKISSKSYHGWVEQIKTALEQFEPYVLSREKPTAVSLSIQLRNI